MKDNKSDRATTVKLDRRSFGRSFDVALRGFEPIHTTAD